MTKVQFTGRKTGRTLYRFRLTEAEAYRLTDESAGACILCGARQSHGIEPDARKYTCPKCDGAGVYGIKELVLMGYATITGPGRE
ncbi:hypothetical protein M0Q28_05635 [Patescibacteria group bacterium]|jgi:hypothetical protein|nr:hypothetical protein [Patescibacteria group bacterium]